MSYNKGRVMDKKGMLLMNKIIGVCLAGIESHYQLSLSNNLNRQANKAGYKLLYFAAYSSSVIGEKYDYGAMKVYDLIQYKMLDALIIYSETIKNDETNYKFVDNAKSVGIPVITIDKPLKGCYNILFNYKSAFEKIVRHVIEYHECISIEYISGIKGMPASDERYDIFLKVMEENGLTVDEERVHYGGFWSGPTNEVMDEILKGGRSMARAYICANDSMAVAVHKRLTEAGYKIPEDVAVTGFDGILQAALLVPAMTTASQDFNASAAKAISILERLFRHEVVEQNHYIDFKIEFKESCGCGEKTHLVNNALLWDSYNEKTMFYNLSKRMSWMVSDLPKFDSYENTLERLATYVHYLNAKKVWVVFKPYDHSLIIKEKFGELYDEEIAFVNLISFSGQNVIEKIMDFDSSNLLHNLEVALNECSNIMFIPLHVLNEDIGYMAIGTDTVWEDFNLYQIFSISLSTTLRVVKYQAEQKHNIKRLEYEHTHDALTGILNRKGFNIRLNQILTECSQLKKLLMIASIDMDGLKYINDNFGHADGDYAIIILADTLSGCIDKGMICARYGGDEFIIAGMIDKKEDASMYELRLRDMLSHHNETSNKPYLISASMGVVTLNPDSDVKVEEYINMADKLMYIQKRQKEKCNI